MSWHIVSDSSCDLTDLTTLEREGITCATVPLKIVVENTEYVDEPSTDVAAMREHIKRFKGSSTSACPSPAAFLEEYRKADYILVFALTSALSGGYNCACQAREMALDEDGSRQIFVLDSHATAGNLVLLMRKAVELIEMGKDFPTVCREITEYNDTLRLFFVLENYDSLVKTGRMSKVAGLAASVLGIRALAANTPEGTIEVLEKPRGMDKALDRMTALVQTRKGGDCRGLPMVISQCANPSGAQALKEKLEAAYGAQVTVLPTRCLTSFYCDEGGLILSF